MIVDASSTKSATTHLKNIMAEANLYSLDDGLDKDFLFKVEVLLKAVAVYYLSLQTISIHDEIDSVEELLQEYSQYTIFSECVTDSEEAGYLLAFRNYMKKALRIIPARRNKMLLVHICAILEGSRRSYVKGGTQSSATTRRTIIYEHESGHEKICRPRPHGHKAVKEEAPPIADKAEVVKCSCGAVVRKHMMPKHVQKDKHKRILAALSEGPLFPGRVLQPCPPSSPCPPSAITEAGPIHLPLLNPFGSFTAFPSVHRADYSSSSSMMPQPSLLTVQYGMPISMSLPIPMPMPMFSPYQRVYQTPAPPMFSSTSSPQDVQAPPMSLWDDLSRWRPLQWQR